MRPLALALLALCACERSLGLAPPGSSPGRGAAQVRVATWNVHDLFDEVDRLVPPGAEDTVPAPAEVEAKLEHVAAVLARIDADVVLLQEVENLALLERLGAAAGYAVARLVEGNDPRGIDVALLSRLPVRAFASHARERDPSGHLLWPRDCVEAHLDAGGRALVIVGSHLSSALSDDGTRRARQAARMRAIADGLQSEDAAALVVVGGDLNDDPDSAALTALLGDGAWRDPLPAAAGTWPSGAPRSRLDYLLVPSAGLSHVLAASTDAGSDVIRASDHQPVVLDLRTE